MEATIGELYAFLDVNIAEDEALAETLYDASTLTDEAYAIGLEYAVRLRAESAAKRRIVEHCRKDQGTVLAGAVGRSLAAVYAFRPGYREEWRP